MAPDRARASYKVGAHSLSVSHKLLERLISSFQPLADLLKARGCGCLDFTARLAKHQPHCVFGHCDPLLCPASIDRITLVQVDHLTHPLSCMSLSERYECPGHWSRLRELLLVHPTGIKSAAVEPNSVGNIEISCWC